MLSYTPGCHRAKWLCRSRKTVIEEAKLNSVKIALDATPLAGPPGGIPRYTKSLAEALAGQFPEDEYWLLSDQAFPAPKSKSKNLSAETCASRRWWSLSLPRKLKRLGIHLFHGTDFAVPYLPLRASVMTVHDLSPWLHPQWQPAAQRVRNRTPVLLKSGIASMVITPSETVRRAAIDYFKLREDRVVAIPLAADDCFRPGNVPARKSPYFLFAGTLEPRKNVARVIDAWRQVRGQTPVDLILAGRCRADFVLPKPETGLQHMDGVSDEVLAALYAGATAVIYPSLYEGFGLPVLEAMQCGALVITSLDPAICEITGHGETCAAIHIQETETRELAAAMRAALGKPDSFSEIRQQALKRAACFSWAKTAAKTREVYEQATRLFSHA